METQGKGRRREGLLRSLTPWLGCLPLSLAGQLASEPVAVNSRALGSKEPCARVVGRWGHRSPTRMVPGDGVVFLESGKQILVLASSNHTTTELIAVIDLNLSSWIRDLTLHGPLLFVACGEEGFIVINVENPRKPMLLATYPTPGKANQVVVFGRNAFVADLEGGLRIFDVSKPEAAREVGHIHTRGRAKRLAVRGKYAYVADSAIGLMVIDVADPVSPKAVGSLVTLRPPLDVGVAGNNVILLDGGGLRIVNVSDPTAPRQIGMYADKRIDAVALRERYAYLLAGDEILVLDISDPTKPEKLGSFGFDGHSPLRTLSVRSHLAYVVDSEFGLQILDVSNPGRIKPIGGFQNWNTEAITVRGHYAYAAGSAAILRILDIANPASPVEVGRLKLFAPPVDIAVLEKYAYLLDNQGNLRVIDLSKPELPQEVGLLRVGTTAQALAVSHNHAFVCTDYDLYAVSVSKPETPRIVAQYELGQCLGLAAAGNSLYVAAGSDGLAVIDISNPAMLHEQGRYDSPGYASGVAVSNQHVFLADGESGLRIVNVEDRTSPVEVASVAIPKYAFSVAVSGPRVFVLAGGDLWVVNVSEPSAPRDACRFDPPSPVARIVGTSDNVYAGMLYAGILIIAPCDGTLRAPR